jgi:hypothetical protein
MGPVAQLVFKTSAVVQPTARSVRLRRRSVSRNPLRQAGFGVSAAGTHQIPLSAQDRSRPLDSGAHWRATGAQLIDSLSHVGCTDHCCNRMGGAGLAVALSALGLQFKSRSDENARAKKRVKIASQLAKGQVLATRLNQFDRASGPWDEIERDIVAWHNETEAILPPEFRSQFESSAGMAFFASQHEDYSRLNNHLIGRLTRLGEIIGHV